MLLSTDSLTKYYNKFLALSNLSMSVDEGSIVGFVGPNGAGKTTAMRIMVTLMKASSGEVFIDGIPLSKDPRAVRGRFGYVPDFFGVYAAITSEEYLNFYADANSVPREGREELIDGLLELVNLTDKKNADVNLLSRGMKQRLCLARSLLHDPKLLILDEPASGLDAQSRLELKYILQALKSRGKGILISSHILPELGEYCDKVVILKQGVKVAEGSLEEISRAIGRKAKISFTLIDPDQFEDAATLIKMSGRSGNVFKKEMNLETEFTGSEEDIAALIYTLVTGGIKISGVSHTKETLEEIFMEVIENEGPGKAE
ncbi:MAG: ABC transporter ATP-binding protein [Clostridia bacterium]|jgi:ABC-type multidrug transport system, ATPase component|nr:ABC transporter ATP-binding protein [Clostridia bacterium]